MVSFAAYSSVRNELKMLEDVSMSEVAFHSEEMWTFNPFTDIDKLKKFLEENVSAQILCFDITINDGIETIEEIRYKNRKINIMLIADTSISPMSYMKPGIMASSLLLRPFSKPQIKSAVRDVVVGMADKDDSDEEMFILKQKEVII